MGKTALKDGKGVMVDSVYRKGEDFLPSDAGSREVTSERLSLATAGARCAAAFTSRGSHMSFYFVQFLTGLASAASLFLVASGLSIIFGVTRIVNFAHGAFYMLGAYVAFTLTERLSGTLGSGAALSLRRLLLPCLACWSKWYCCGGSISRRNCFSFLPPSV